jgi:hypothetical protein
MSLGEIRDGALVIAQLGRYSGGVLSRQWRDARHAVAIAVPLEVRSYRRGA